MNYWFFSTEPGSFPWQNVERDHQVRWDGIRGGAAQKYMRLITPGDGILAYHSSPEKSVVGLAEAASRSYSEPGVPPEEKEKWHVLDVRWRKWLTHPVPIATLRKTNTLVKMKFLIMSRLSISPVTPAEWKTVLDLGR